MTAQNKEKHRISPDYSVYASSTNVPAGSNIDEKNVGPGGARAAFENACRFLRIPRVGERPGRDLGVDALRGLAILLVVIIHSCSYAVDTRLAGPYDLLNYLHSFLHAFSVPLFFLISGYVLFDKRIRILDRVLMLIVPFIAWIPFYWLVNTYMRHWPSSLWETFVNTLKEPALGLWFLPVLFICSLLLVPARHLEKIRGWMGEAYLVVAFVTVNLLPAEILGIWQTKFFFLFFALGYLAAKHRQRVERLGGKRINVLLLGLSSLFLVSYTCLYYCGRINQPPLPVSLYDLATEPLGYITRYLMAVLGIVFSVALVRSLKTGRGRTAMAWVGLVTMDIYVAHGLTYQVTFGTGWVQVLISVMSGVFLSLALSFFILRQWQVTALLFLGIRPEWLRKRVR